MSKELEHGKLGTYTNERCRCEKCREAQSKYMQDYRKEHRYSQDGNECELADCNNRGMLTRGLCTYHYNLYLNKVNKGETTWSQVYEKKD